MRAFRNQCLVKPRSDLEPSLSDANVNGYTISGILGRPGFVEVVHCGPGGHVAPGKDMPDVKPGDVCLIDLGEVSKDVREHGQKLWMMPGPELRAKIHLRDGKVDTEREPYPLMDQVLTARDPEAFAVAMYGEGVRHIELTEGILRDGMPSNDIRGTVQNFVYERVRDWGPGRVRAYGKGAHVRYFYVPTVGLERGDLVLFNTNRSLKFTIGDKPWKLTPASDLDGAVDE